MYILSRKWLSKWKNFVNYPFIKRKMQYAHLYMQKNLKPYLPDASLRPGLIENMEILEPLDNFLNDGSLNNQSNLIIRSNINQKEEVKICSRKIWEFFQTRYGGGPEIIKPWISEGSFIFNNRKIIELYSRKVNILILPERRRMSKEKIYSLNTCTLCVSRYMNLTEIKERFIEILLSIQNNGQERYDGKSLFDSWSNNANFNIQNFKIWKIKSESNLDEFKEYLLKNFDEIVNTDTELDPGEQLTFLEYTSDQPLKDVEFADSDIAVLEYISHSSQAIFEVKQIEIRDTKCYWCNEYRKLKYFCSCKEIGFCSAYCQKSGTSSHSSSCKRGFSVEQDSLAISLNSRLGLAGLQNLGNTCFMNTSLQCLSNCQELTKYFIGDYYQKHINTDNPIGTQGILAKAYSNLLKNLWYGSSTVYSPWNFKTAVERFQSMFIGYQQHDTQEFLNYLLDGLHEDLNKVIKKPLVEKDDAIKDDRIKSKEQWVGFLKRNQSILVDLMYGQYKSTLYCPDRNCQNISTTFDPFVSISLPIISTLQKYQVKCYFIFYEISTPPIQLTLSFTMDTTIMALRNKISKLMNIHPFSFVIVKMDRNGELDYFVNSSMSLITKTEKVLHKNQMPFFCFQIDPNIFYSKLCNSLHDLDLTEKRDFSKINEELIKKKEEKRYLVEEEYFEDQTGQTKETMCYYSKFNILIDGKIKPVAMKINTDNNHGLRENLIRIVLNIRKYEDMNNTRIKLNFPRIIYLDKNSTTKAVHLHLSEYFSHILRKRCPIDSFNIWDTFFPDLEETTRDIHIMSYEDHRMKAFPYLIRIKNIFTRLGGHCIFCKGTTCEDCLLPCREDITIQDMLEKIPKNHDMSIDNSYYYLIQKQRDTCQVRETEFVLDITWLKEYESLVRTLNDKSDFEFESKEGQHKDSISINSCFRNFAKLEKLDEDNEWFCPKCKTHKLAEKKMEIYNSPHILTIHLKRFKNNSKLGTLVNFPINGLDISKHVISQEEQCLMTYDLFAIANHYGGLSGGHYVAYAKNKDNWYMFNDSSVTQIDESELITSTAYVLFYRRRDLDKCLNLENLFSKPFVNYEYFEVEQIYSSSRKNHDCDPSLKNEIRMMEICEDVIINDKI